MKLYVSATSERATKGQGGNKQINLAIYIDDKVNPRYRLFITKQDDDSTDIVLTDQTKPFPKNKVFEDKIKSQKAKNGDICQHCGKQHNNALCDSGMK